jgi:MFS family permease
MIGSSLVETEVMASRGQRAFHSSSFRYLFFGRLLTVLGNGIAPIALAFAVLDIGGSATDLGLVVAARSLFNVIFLLLGGVLADRYSRSLVLVSSSLVAAVAQGMVAWLVLDGSATIMLLAVLGRLTARRRALPYPPPRRWCRKRCRYVPCAKRMPLFSLAFMAVR